MLVAGDIGARLAGGLVGGGGTVSTGSDECARHGAGGEGRRSQDDRATILVVNPFWAKLCLDWESVECE